MSKFCIIAIFMQNVRNIRDYCQIRVRTNSILPMVNYVTDGQRVVSTKERINCAIVCDRSLLHRTATSTITVDPSIQVVKLNMACSATTDTLTLPLYYHDESKYDISNSLDQFTYRFNASTIKMWEQFHSALPNFSMNDLPKKLNNIENIPMDNLIAELKTINTVPQLSDDWPIWIDVIVGAIIVLGVILFIYCYIRGPPRCFKKLCPRSVMHESSKSEKVESIPMVSDQSNGTDNADREKASAPLLQEQQLSKLVDTLYPTLGLKEQPKSA